ncbi:hypothetical protein OEZ86_009207 [Tetradesmus obliquus]|nr:hypothetical protein OEZ86_009207 [Tetradesmus obliquus]
MPGQPAVAVLTPALPPPTSAFVVAAEPATTQPDSDLFFGDVEGLETPQRPEAIDVELVEELVGEIQHIKGNSGVGSPEVRKYVDAWSPPEASSLQAGTAKEAALRALAEALYQRRPVLYLKGHAQPYPAQVLLRTVRKPSVGALSTAAAAAGLFKSPSNTVIVIKFDPQFGYADIIVDPFFTDAFIQQPATPTYSQLLSQLPRAFVGTAVELRRVVALLTQQSMRAYASKGAACPPWRRFDAMLARWLPKRFTDEPISHGPGSAAAPAAAAAVPTELLRLRFGFEAASSGAAAAAAAAESGVADAKAGEQEALGLAAAVARIREAVLAVDVAAAVPVGGSREVWGRKVLRLDAVK